MHVMVPHVMKMEGIQVKIQPKRRLDMRIATRRARNMYPELSTRNGFTARCVR